MIRKNKKQNTGFTVIEMMIAIAIFLIVVVIGMGALLNTNLIHRKTQDMRSIMDSLSFIMEDMSRNLRTGSDYVCNYGCNNGGGILFKSQYGDEWEYTLEQDGTGAINIMRTIEGNKIQLNPTEVKIVGASSGFTVTGTAPFPDPNQPFVTIKLIGKITYKGVDTPFSLQTSVSQRLIDIAP